jgi:hypothetical protein
MNHESKRIKLPKFDRQAIFAEVDASNRRFEDYTSEERRELATSAKAQRVGMHEARRARY